MADEITYSGFLSFSKGGKSDEFGFGGLLADMSGGNFIHASQTLPNDSAAAINLGGVTTPGYALIKNLSTLYSIAIRMGSGGANVITIPPGEVAGPFKFASTNPYAVASNAAGAQFEYLIVEA